MSQEPMEEYEKLHQQLKEIRARIKEIKPQLTCTYCGAQNYYAKGFCRSCYARYKARGTPEYAPKKVAKPKCVGVKTDWKDRLYEAVFSEERTSETPNDLEESIYLVIKTLTPREEKMVLLRYKDCLTLEQCGQHFGLQKERARQIINKAVRKLRHPSRAGYLINGAKRQREIERENNIQHRLKFENLMKQGNERLDSAILSVRAYNCLLRAGIEDRNGVLEYISKNGGDVYSLLKIRNCGIKTVEEIIEKFDIKL